jgi:hypothetical protein
MKFQFITESSNSKIGKIPATNSPRQTCPSNCPLSGDGGCYAEAGFHTRINWDALDQGKRGLEWSAFIAKIQALPAFTLWRHNVSGDLVGKRDGLIDRAALLDLVEANRGRKGFTYTHYPLTTANKALIKAANNNGFTINVSTETLSDAVKRHKQGLPTVTLLPENAPKSLKHAGVDIVTCPATYRDTTCKECRLCSIAKRDFIIGFPVHGTKKKQAEKHIDHSIIAKG